METLIPVLARTNERFDAAASEDKHLKSIYRKTWKTWTNKAKIKLFWKRLSWKKKRRKTIVSELGKKWQWLWRSWQSGPFKNQISAVGIPISPFNLSLNLSFAWCRKDGNEEKEARLKRMKGSMFKIFPQKIKRVFGEGLVDERGRIHRYKSW